MSKINCFFGGSRTQKLYGKYLSKHTAYPISLEKFNTIISQLQSDSNINFSEWLNEESDSMMRGLFQVFINKY